MTLNKTREEEEIGRQVLAAAMRVHTALGPGLLEGAYEICLASEIAQHGLEGQRQVTLPLVYREQGIDAGYRLDMLVDGRVVVEVKAVEKLLPIHLAQVLTYLRLGKYSLGYLLNFNVLHMRQGIKRIVL
ncbi:MAG: GxxExxY protein [Burkholderiales bacterium]